jgi:hypothetical protein
MQKLFLRSLTSFFFLFLFLFPMVEKQMHALEHAGDTHCQSSDKHFHTEEHSCTICDITFSDTNPLAENIFSFIAASFELSFKENSKEVHTPGVFPHLPSRAPPLA